MGVRLGTWSEGLVQGSELRVQQGSGEVLGEGPVRVRRGSDEGLMTAR